MKLSSPKENAKEPVVGDLRYMKFSQVAAGVYDFINKFNEHNIKTVKEYFAKYPALLT